MLSLRGVSPSKITSALRRNSKYGLIALVGAAAATGLWNMFKGKDEGKKPEGPEFKDPKTGVKKPPGKKVVPPKKVRPQFKAPVKKGPMAKADKKVATKRQAYSKVAKPETLRATKERLKQRRAGKQTGNKFITGEEAAVASFATVLASKVPWIHRTAKDIAGFLGKNLRPLGMAGLAAGSVWAISRYLASRRKGTTFSGKEKGAKSKAAVSKKATQKGVPKTVGSKRPVVDKKPMQKTGVEKGRSFLDKVKSSFKSPSKGSAGRVQARGADRYRMGSSAASMMKRKSANRPGIDRPPEKTMTVVPRKRKEMRRRY